MTYSYPLSLAALADLFEIETVVWDIQRNDELSGTGDGRVWQAELASPLWTAEVTLASNRHHVVKQIAARVRKLYGAQESFMLYDPLSMFPHADRNGSILAGSTVTVKAIGENRKSLSLQGLPGGYVLTPGDKMQVTYSSEPALNFFCEVSEDVVADEDGDTAAFEIFPHIPAGVAADDAVVLARPACKVFILPNSFKPGTARGANTEGASFKAVERRR